MGFSGVVNFFVGSGSLRRGAVTPNFLWCYLPVTGWGEVGVT